MNRRPPFFVRGRGNVPANVPANVPCNGPGNDAPPGHDGSANPFVRSRGALWPSPRPPRRKIGAGRACRGLTGSRGTPPPAPVKLCPPGLWSPSRPALWAPPAKTYGPSLGERPPGEFRRGSPNGRRHGDTRVLGGVIFVSPNGIVPPDFSFAFRPVREDLVTDPRSASAVLPWLLESLNLFGGYTVYDYVLDARQGRSLGKKTRKIPLLRSGGVVPRPAAG